MKLNLQNDKPALLGGSKAFEGRFPSWPIYDRTEEEALLEVLHSDRWGRLDGDVTARFEAEYARLMGMKHALGTTGGTTALTTMLGALGIGPGDEVIIPAYTFVATYNVVVLNYALPIIVDTDIDSFQIDTRRMERAITKDTRALMPVHMGGVPADLDKIVAMAQKHKLPVIEDACQAPGSEWKGKKVGSYGVGGAFSFQSSKNLNCAEGGAVTTNDSDFYKACYAFHHQGQTENTAGFGTGEGTRGTNSRMTEWQARMLLAQMTRFQEQDKRRTENAYYLNSLFKDVKGIYPAKVYPGTTNVSYHLYMFRYDRTHFAGMPRARFIEAMRAEGIGTSTGYGRLDTDPYVAALAQNPHYLKVYGERTMKQWLERIKCPQNVRLSEQALWISQSVLLGSRQDMDKIAEAVRKIQKYANELKA
jgi:dTDP-4-amino-4,6-dideoxygalactose transaminase